MPGAMTSLRCIATETSSGGMWQTYSAESPMSTQFSPFAQPSGATGAWTSGTSEAGSHEDMAWQEFGPPSRSMSYGGDGGGGPQQLQYLTVGEGQPFERRTPNLPEAYPQPFGTPVASMTPGPMRGMDEQDAAVAASTAPSVEPWLPQAQAQYGGWPYDKAGGSQHVWLEEQRQQMTAATRAPSDSYYSA